MALAGIDPEGLRGPGATVASKDFAELLELVAEDLGDSCLGLSWSQSFPVFQSGIVGYLVAHARDLHQALETSARFSNLEMSPVESRAKLERADEFATGELSWIWPPWLPPSAIQYKFLMAAVIVTRLRSGTAKPWMPRQIALQCADVGCRPLAARIFGPNVAFDMPRNTIVVFRESLSLPMTKADSGLFDIIVKQAESQLVDIPHRGELVQKVRAEILDRVGRREISIEAIAETLNVPVRTLQARLAQQAGTTFEAILSAARRDLARHYLGNTDLSLTEIAFNLGYSELSAFTRAAQRWFGRPPSALRQKLRA